MVQTAIVEKIAPAIGAEIHGLDLGQHEDAETFAFLYDALMEHQGAVDDCVAQLLRPLIDEQLSVVCKRSINRVLAPCAGC